MASLSKMFAATATYPYQVVRSRLHVRTDQKLFDVLKMVQPFRCKAFKTRVRYKSSGAWDTLYDFAGLVTSLGEVTKRGRVTQNVWCSTVECFFNYFFSKSMQCFSCSPFVYCNLMFRILKQVLVKRGGV